MGSYEDMEWVVNGEEGKDPVYEVVDKVTVRRLVKDEKNDSDDSDDCTHHQAILANNSVFKLDYQYFEMKLRKKDNFSHHISVGLATKDLKGYDGKFMPGYDESADHAAFSYHWDNGNIYCDGDSYGGYYGTISPDDVVGCGIDFDGLCFITVNGKRLEKDGSRKAIMDNGKKMIYPLITLYDSDTEVVTNFGNEEFMYNPKPTTFWEEWMYHLRQTTKVEGYFGDFHDLTIISKDEEEIHCHRFILSLRSKSLKEMIQTQEEGKIKLDNYDGSTIRRMVRFLYTDVIEFEDGELNFELFNLAKELEIEGLKREFGKSMVMQINEKNVIELWLKGRRLESKELINGCRKFIKEHFNDFKESEGFLALVAEDKMTSIMLMVDVVSFDEDDGAMKQLQNMMKDFETSMKN